MLGHQSNHVTKEKMYALDKQVHNYEGLCRENTF